MSEFLPQGYSIPQSPSSYMKLEQGENKFRILSSAITGFEYWNTENKPVRSAEPFKETPGIKIGKDGKKSIKPFWAFVVWNYKQERVQIMEITQSTIMRAIKSLVDNSDWGDPKTYDLVIKRDGEDINTEYSVMPCPRKDLPETAKEVYNSMKIKLEALYDNGDPFQTEDTNDIRPEDIF